MPDGMTDLDAIPALFARYLTAYAAGDADGVAATFAADGKLFTPFGPPAFGRAAIAATHAEWFLDGERDKILRVIECDAEGAMGHALVGFAATVDAEDDRSGRIFGMSLNTLRRNDAGDWLIRQCCLNMLDTPPKGFPE